jgi:hypothetical protein
MLRIQCTYPCPKRNPCAKCREMYDRIAARRAEAEAEERQTWHAIKRENERAMREAFEQLCDECGPEE